MLHIVTPLFRYQYLDRIYASLATYPDVIWHIAKSRHRPPLTNTFLTDHRVRIYELHCADNDTITKRNHAFDQIQDGYFYLLDDDTLLHPNLYLLYKLCAHEDFVGMAVGSTYRRRIGVTHRGKPPVSVDTFMDTGMFLSHHSVLRHIRWAHRAGVPNDRHFWHRCYQYFGPQATRVVGHIIAWYNYFGPPVRVRKRLFGYPINIDIYNGPTAWLYHRGHLATEALRRLLGIRRPHTVDDRFLSSYSAGPDE
jgi:hypothetical protein